MCEKEIERKLPMKIIIKKKEKKCATSDESFCVEVHNKS